MQRKIAKTQQDWGKKQIHQRKKIIWTEEDTAGTLNTKHRQGQVRKPASSSWRGEAQITIITIKVANLILFGGRLRWRHLYHPLRTQPLPHSDLVLRVGAAAAVFVFFTFSLYDNPLHIILQGPNLKKICFFTELYIVVYWKNPHTNLLALSTQRCPDE